MGKTVENTGFLPACEQQKNSKGKNKIKKKIKIKDKTKTKTKGAALVPGGGRGVCEK